MIKKFFITGTDTGIGKTFISCLLLNNLSKLGFLVSGYKPVSTGCKHTKNGIRNRDVLLLIENSNTNFTYEQVNPFAFISETSPNIASKIEKKRISIKILSEKLKFFDKKIDYLIIEGIGGWFTPLNRKFKMSDWVEHENIPIIMVVGIKLGCLNHALLTAYSIKQKNLKLVGWIANQIYDSQTFAVENYIQTLQDRICVPMIGHVPHFTLFKKDDYTEIIDLSFLMKEDIIS